MRKILPFCMALVLTGCNAPRRQMDAAWYPEEPLTLAERQHEARVKLERVQEFLKRENLAGVLITTERNLAWITAGGDSSAAIAVGSAAPLFIRDDGERFLITSNGRTPLRNDEGLKGMGYQLREIPWYGDKREPSVMNAVLQELTGSRPFVSDAPHPGARVVRGEIAELRAPLTETEMRKYRWLGKRCAEAVDAVCRRIQPGMTERGIEALLSDALMRRAIRPVALFAASDGRIRSHRHASASNTGKVEQYVTVSITACRWGLIIAMSRTVHFGPLPEDLKNRVLAVARVNAGFWARTVPGASAGLLLAGAIADYAETGYPGEWEKRHQGGAIGYEEREWLALPGSDQTVRANQAFAWNPAIQEVKMEDTILLAGGRLEVLTEIPGWPVVETKALGRIYRSPGILIR